MKSSWAKLLCRLLMVLMVWSPVQFAQAGMIGTDQVVTAASQTDRSDGVGVPRPRRRRDATAIAGPGRQERNRARRRDDRLGSADAGGQDQQHAGRRGQHRCDPAAAHRRCGGVVDLVPPLAIRSVLTRRPPGRGRFHFRRGERAVGLREPDAADQGACQGAARGPAGAGRAHRDAVLSADRIPVRAGGARHRARRERASKSPTEELVPQVYLPERKGSLQVEMLAAARRHGMVSYQLAPRFEDMMREIAAGTPVVVLQNLGVFSSGWHYAVAIGYDYQKRHAGAALRARRSATCCRSPCTRWCGCAAATGRWWPLPPDKIPATADENRWLAAIAALERAGDARSSRTAYTHLSRPLAGERERGRGAGQHAPRLGRARRSGNGAAQGGDAARRIRWSCSITWRRRCPTSGATRKRCRSPSARLRPADRLWVLRENPRRDRRAATQQDWRGRATPVAAAAGSRAPRRPPASARLLPRGWCRPQ